jgi:sugar phosphate isomerase/epimerase
MIAPLHAPLLHPRISLHQVAMMDRDTPAFLAHCAASGIPTATLVTPKLAAPGALKATLAALPNAPRVTCLNHPFAIHPNLESDTGGAAEGLSQAIAMASALGAPSIYLISGGRGTFDWEAAAERFAALIAPGIAEAQAHGIRLLVENANAFNADIHIAHTLPDTLLLAETAGIDICLDLATCWAESGLKATFARALPHIGLVQVSDYVLGDRATPCRAVPGDGAIPLTRLIAQLLEAGYTGRFDLELVGPRITAEGAEAATLRAATWLSETLVKLGA